MLSTARVYHALRMRREMMGRCTGVCVDRTVGGGIDVLSGCKEGDHDLERRGGKISLSGWLIDPDRISQYHAETSEWVLANLETDRTKSINQLHFGLRRSGSFTDVLCFKAKSHDCVKDMLDLSWR